MKVAITGASGFLGRELVPSLANLGYELLLVGRSRDALAKLFSGHEVTSYEGLAQSLNGCQALIHLAVQNNTLEASDHQFHQANVGLLEEVIAAAKAAGVKKLVYTSTTHVSDSATAYGRTKAAAEDLLRQTSGLEVALLRLPIVHGTEFGGKLARLNALPNALQKPAFMALASLKPTVHAECVKEAIVKALNAPGNFEDLVTDQQRGNWFYYSVRKIIDIAFALAVLVLLFWLLIAIWVAVKFTSEGPGIFAQQRVGRNGKLFTLYKFRTMAKDTKQAGSHEVSAASLTRIGSFLRKTKLDELPQIFNMLKGEISLIGPRPCLPVQEELVEARKERNVLSIMPGITGYAQVRGIDMSDPEKLARHDEEYMKLRTLPLDLNILIDTFTGKGNGDRVKA